MFAKMAQVEQNPHTEEAKEYYKKLSKLSSKSASKRKPAAVIIKNVRGGKMVSQT